MKKTVFLLVFIALTICNSLAQTPIFDSTKVYDTVTDNDNFYLFSTPKPCFNPGIYHWAPVKVMVQEYVPSDTVTVYGVAIPLSNYYSNNPICDNITGYKALLMNRLGISPLNYRAFSFELVDSVTLNRSQPRFCWFRYEDNCDSAKSLVAPCYEFYFDTPEQMNRMTDTFYVGRYWDIENTPGISFQEYGGEYSTSIPSTIYQSIELTEGYSLDFFFQAEGYQDRKWGVFFPIIGFRCRPVSQCRLDSYWGDVATVSWNGSDEGGLYEVQLLGEDGSDTTYLTSGKTLVFQNLSDSVRYNVRVRKQCHYATSNYDTTVYSDWHSNLYFGTTILPDTTGNDTVVNPNDTIVNPNDTIVNPDDTLAILRVESEGFTLRPNPTHGKVQVIMPETAKGEQLSVCDLAGRELLVRTVVSTTMEIDISALPAGAYFVKLTTPAGPTTKKLLIQ